MGGAGIGIEKLAPPVKLCDWKLSPSPRMAPPPEGSDRLGVVIRSRDPPGPLRRDCSVMVVACWTIEHAVTDRSHGDRVNGRQSGPRLDGPAIFSLCVFSNAFIVRLMCQAADCVTGANVHRPARGRPSREVPASQRAARPARRVRSIPIDAGTTHAVIEMPIGKGRAEALVARLECNESRVVPPARASRLSLHSSRATSLSCVSL